jgi:ligand-binding SRPBCC domain-containing protein
MGLTYSSVVRTEPVEVFAWQSRPGAITRLMPPWHPVSRGAGGTFGPRRARRTNLNRARLRRRNVREQGGW